MLANALNKKKESEIDYSYKVVLLKDGKIAVEPDGEFNENKILCSVLYIMELIKTEQLAASLAEHFRQEENDE